MKMMIQSIRVVRHSSHSHNLHFAAFWKIDQILSKNLYCHYIPKGGVGRKGGSNVLHSNMGWVFRKKKLSRVVCTFQSRRRICNSRRRKWLHLLCLKPQNIRNLAKVDGAFGKSRWRNRRAPLLADNPDWDDPSCWQFIGTRKHWNYTLQVYIFMGNLWYCYMCYQMAQCWKRLSVEIVL